jgi:peptidoglycan/xylan/chitin deacetylase (PgdA/CDA1 family)
MRPRDIAASFLAGAGFTSLVDIVRRATRREPRALVLMYHRVSPDPDYLGMSVSPAHFDQQMALLRTRARVLPLVQLVEWLEGRERPPQDVAAVTFDDGYRDNLEVALPILERHGVPATVFVTTDFVDGIGRPSGERLRQSFASLWDRGLGSSAWTGIGVKAIDDLAGEVLEHPGSLERLATLAFSLPGFEATVVERLLLAVDRLAGDVGTSISMLDWAGVRALASRGVEIGSHSVSHPILSRIPDDRARLEVVASKARLEREIGRPVVGFAYPNGHAADFTAADVGRLRAAGYRYACAADRGVNRSGCDPFRLLRIGVGDYGASTLDLKLALGR